MDDAPENGSIQPGLTPERVGFFTDAVFAIAMTLLVIEIPRPEGSEFGVGNGVSKADAAAHLWHFLAHQANAFYAYALAFYILWVVWRQHHVLFDRIAKLSPVIVGWHFPLLLLVGFLPYVTTVLGHYPANPLAALLFGLVVGGLLICRSIIQSWAYRGNLLHSTVDVAQFRADTRTSWLVVGYWMLILALLWWTPWIQIAWFLTSLVGSSANWLLRPRPAPTAAAA